MKRGSKVKINTNSRKRRKGRARKKWLTAIKEDLTPGFNLIFRELEPIDV